MNNIPSFVQLAQLKQQRIKHEIDVRKDNAAKSDDKCNAEIELMAGLKSNFCFCDVSTTDAYRNALSAVGYSVEEQHVPIFNKDGDSTGKTEIGNYKVSWK